MTKTYDDYIDKVVEAFPDVPKETVVEIIRLLLQNLCEVISRDYPIRVNVYQATFFIERSYKRRDKKKAYNIASKKRVKGLAEAYHLLSDYIQEYEMFLPLVINHVPENIPEEFKRRILKARMYPKLKKYNSMVDKHIDESKYGTTSDK